MFPFIRAVFSVIGLISVLFIVWLKVSGSSFTINIHKENKELKALYRTRVKALKTAGRYSTDSVDFKISIVQNPERARKILEYFKMEWPEGTDTWTKATNIASFVARSIPHANQTVQPEHLNAIDLWEYTKNVEPAFNCRLHSILTFELMLAAGLTPKFVTCLPKDRNDDDCHVVNEIWLPELGKWAMIDSDMGGNYATNKYGTPLSLAEMRKYYITGKKMYMHPGFGDGDDSIDQYYYSYMAKNTYWFMCWENLTYGVEDHRNDGIDPGRVIYLIPSGFKPFNTWENSVTTSNDELFWAKPE